MTTTGIQPRPQQVDALTALTRAFAVHDRTQLLMACGTGKTLVGRWHAQAAEAQRTVVFLPSLALLAQTLGEWRRVTGWPFEALVVCSDPTTTAGAAERRRDDGESADVARPYWATVRAKVTTSPAEAAGFLARKVDGRPQVVFCTYHSAPVLVTANRWADIRFDLAICDEAHRLAGRPRDEFRTVLDDRKINARKRLFMTATAQDTDGDDALSMNDPAVFGPVAHQVTFGQAIDAGMLTDYQVLVVAGRPDSRPYDRTGPGTVPGALLDAVDRHGIRRLLSFHGRVAKAKAFAEVVDAVHSPGGGFIRAKHVNGKQSAADRAATLAWLGDDETRQVKLVSSARCLTEGIDIPAVDGVLFADQRTSVVDIIQAVGRVLRPSPGKSRGNVIIPVTLPDGGDDDTTLALSAFGHVWQVLRGLRAHDQRLADELDRAVAGEGHRRRGRISLPEDRIQFLLPDDVDEPAVHLRLVEEIGSGWDKFYQATLDWAHTHHGRRMPRLTSHLGVGVGNWAANQRQAYAHGQLDADRVARLQEVPGWYWNLDDADWTDTYRFLEDLAAANGTIADNDRGESAFTRLYSKGSPQWRLGVWMARQRQAHRDGMLDPDRARLLEKLPGWAWDAGLPGEHVAMVQALRLFCEFEHHADVPEDHVEDGLPLGRWVWATRRANLLGQLPPALADEIAAAAPQDRKGRSSWQWEQVETQWRLMYSALREYARSYGHASPAGTYKAEFAGTTVGVGQWVARQRFLHRRGELDDRWVQWLEALPGWQWDGAGVTKAYGEPIDLGGWPHGTAKGIAANCPCRECLDARRAADRDRIAERRKLTDPVPADAARAHLGRLEQAGVKRSAIVAVSGVSLGTIRKIAAGEWTELERAHEQAILACTREACAVAAASLVGSRGRLVCADNEKIDAGPTVEILDDLKRRGFGNVWVAQELGYAYALQIRRTFVTRRIAAQVAELADRVGDLTYPRHGNQHVPPLAELLARRDVDAQPRRSA